MKHRFILRDGADIRRLAIHLATHWAVPRIDVQVLLPEREVQRAQHRMTRLADASEYQSAGPVLAVTTLALGVAQMIRTLDESLQHLGWVILATLCAGLIGKAGGMIWSHARILLELRHLRRRMRTAPPLSPAPGQSGLARGAVIGVQATPAVVAAPSVQDRLPAVVAFLTDLERLKLVTRKAYVSDLSRRENSAEHSWHLALGLLTLAQELNLRIDLHKALVMALIHDVCEIDAGDSPVYDPVRHDQHEAELACVNRLASHEVRFGQNLRELWLEFEAQQSRESRWVKVLDRVMPFVVNLATEGRNWKELAIRRSQVLQVSKAVQEHAPEIYAWMEQRSLECVRAGWLIDG